MNRRKIVDWVQLTVLAAVVCGAALAVYAKARPAANVEQEVRSFEVQANAAYEANDLAKYFSFYADDFSQFLPEGRTDLASYKKMWTEYIGAGNKVQKVKLSDMKIQVGPNGDTAVVSYILHVETKLKDGKVSVEDNQESDTLFKRNGQWKIVFLHYSAAPKK